MVKLSQEVRAKAKRMAARAVQLDSTLAEAHVSMALVKFVIDWDWKAAESEFCKAIDCDPAYVNAHHFFGIFHLRLGRPETASTEFRRALQLDSSNPNSQFNLGHASYWTGRYRPILTGFSIVGPISQKIVQVDRY